MAKIYIEDIVFRRTFVWVTLKVIGYLVDKCRLEQAQYILEKIESCKGICGFALDNTQEPTHYSCGKSQGIMYRVDCGCKG